MLLLFMLFFFYVSGVHRELHVLTHAFPTLRSSELRLPAVGQQDQLGDAQIEQDLRADAIVAQLVGRRSAADTSTGTRLDPVRQRRRMRFADQHKDRSEEHTYELQSLMRISYAVFCLKKKI